MIKGSGKRPNGETVNWEINNTDEDLIRFTTKETVVFIRSRTGLTTLDARALLVKIVRGL